jgi:hypothetical protein
MARLGYSGGLVVFGQYFVLQEEGQAMLNYSVLLDLR